MDTCHSPTITTLMSKNLLSSISISRAVSQLAVTPSTNCPSAYWIPLQLRNNPLSASSTLSVYRPLKDKLRPLLRQIELGSAEGAGGMESVGAVR